MRWARLVYLVLAMYMMLAMWSNPIIERGDSGAYVFAGWTLAREGEMYLNINYPLMTMTVQRNPYTEWMPGLPLLYAPFMRFSDDPYDAALLVQLAFIPAFYLALYAVSKALQLTALPSAALVVVVTFTAPFAYVGRAFISELPLSVCLLMVLWAALRYREKRNPGYLYAGWMALVAGAFLRFNGFAIAAPLVWGLLLRREPRRVVVTGLLALLPAVGWYLRNKVLYGVTSYTHDTHAAALSALMPPLEYAASLLTHPVLVPVALSLLLWLVWRQRRVSDVRLLIAAFVGQAVVFGGLTVFSAYPFAPRHVYSVVLPGMLLAFVLVARAGWKASVLLALMALPMITPPAPVSLERYTPPEKALWARLNPTGVTQYVTLEGNMVHQWYADAFGLAPWHDEAVPDGMPVVSENEVK